MAVNVCVRYPAHSSGSATVNAIAEVEQGLQWCSGSTPDYFEENYRFENRNDAFGFALRANCQPGVTLAQIDKDDDVEGSEFLVDSGLGAERQGFEGVG